MWLSTSCWHPPLFCGGRFRLTGTSAWHGALYILASECSQDHKDWDCQVSEVREILLQKAVNQFPPIHSPLLPEKKFWGLLSFYECVFLSLPLMLNYLSNMYVVSYRLFCSSCVRQCKWSDDLDMDKFWVVPECPKHNCKRTDAWKQQTKPWISPPSVGIPPIFT